MKKIIKEEKIDIKKYGVEYDKRGKLFSVYAAHLKGLRGGMTHDMILFNPKTGGEMKFKFDGVDKYGSGEDEEIAGWRFKTANNEYHFLIIND